MATAPLNPMPSAMDNMPADGGATDAPAGYCIEIYVMPGGTFKVKKEMKEEPPMMEEAGTPEMTADNIGDALKLVLDILEKEGSDMADEQFDEGFGTKKPMAKATPGMPADQM